MAFDVPGAKRDCDDDVPLESNRLMKRRAASHSFDLDGPNDPIAHWALDSSWPAVMSKLPAKSTLKIQLKHYKKDVFDYDCWRRYGVGSFEPMPTQRLGNFEYWEEKGPWKIVNPLRRTSDRKWRLKKNNNRPWPTISIGLEKKAFTSSQLEKLEIYNTDRPATFSTLSKQFFPFSVGEILAHGCDWDKGKDKESLDGSTIIDAIVQLCDAVKPEEIDELQARVLGFGMVHDDEDIFIHGHFFTKE
ncbi:hypothetical protein K470DRAFT_295587 [Piedraia hortae CBS 480.64]|uniref:DUF7924 domain-containing protein n=1 Tax=Piedraia hortae CBS 480.64 TaxID=1314780 RepID=A0A6A7BWV8_9PEZI|nr:hypothetical protein K470DRAFT_295587 [Piedraia hortae CBS 480.64]